MSFLRILSAAVWKQSCSAESPTRSSSSPQGESARSAYEQGPPRTRLLWMEKAPTWPADWAGYRSPNVRATAGRTDAAALKVIFFASGSVLTRSTTSLMPEACRKPWTNAVAST